MLMQPSLEVNRKAGLTVLDRIRYGNESRG